MNSELGGNDMRIEQQKRSAFPSSKNVMSLAFFLSLLPNSTSRKVFGDFS